jgi:hypothetical protein
MVAQIMVAQIMVAQIMVAQIVVAQIVTVPIAVVQYGIHRGLGGHKARPYSATIVGATLVVAQIVVAQNRGIIQSIPDSSLPTIHASSVPGPPSPPNDRRDGPGHRLPQNPGASCAN